MRMIVFYSEILSTKIGICVLFRPATHLRSGSTISPSLPGTSTGIIIQYMAKQYYCNCKERCGGKRREVSKPTYFRHRQYRSIFSSTMQSFLDENPVTMHAASSSHATDENTVMDTTSGPPSKRTCHSVNDTSDIVCVFSQGYAHPH